MSYIKREDTYRRLYRVSNSGSRSEHIVAKTEKAAIDYFLSKGWARSAWNVYIEDRTDAYTYHHDDGYRRENKTHKALAQLLAIPTDQTQRINKPATWEGTWEIELE